MPYAYVVKTRGKAPAIVVERGDDLPPKAVPLPDYRPLFVFAAGRTNDQGQHGAATLAIMPGDDMDKCTAAIVEAAGHEEDWGLGDIISDAAEEPGIQQQYGWGDPDEPGYFTALFIR